MSSNTDPGRTAYPGACSKVPAYRALFCYYPLALLGSILNLSSPFLSLSFDHSFGAKNALPFLPSLLTDQTGEIAGVMRIVCLYPISPSIERQRDAEVVVISAYFPSKQKGSKRGEEGSLFCTSSRAILLDFH